MIKKFNARHTWASIANGAGINIHHIAQALGHRSIKTTEIYLAGLQTDELFNDSRTVAERIKKVLTERHRICNIHTSRQNVVFYAVLIENISLFRRINKKMQVFVTKK